ncbi:hypothetical protein [Paenibacillus sp. 32O-W]|uniref:hypothetical protein n=1 Tax=Paenibacillus sp. 32O-W TaxID=1695218 RepID=UPI0011AA0E45|nr:hypothetical protein [Paenibacillus sp. 32O-W]
MSGVCHVGEVAVQSWPENILSRRGTARAFRLERVSQRSNILHDKYQEWIREADTFFIGSVSAEGKMDAYI